MVDIDEEVGRPRVSPSSSTVPQDRSQRDSSKVQAKGFRATAIEEFRSTSPKDWPAKKKWTSLMILSSFAFVHPLSETMIAPAMDVIAADLHFTSHYDSMLCLSIFLIGIAIGPLLLAPLSEVYGRRPILIAGGVFYTIWTVVCGFARTKEQLFVFRALSGFGASVALAIGGGVIGDVWKAEERGRALAWYLLAPLLGPAIGPIVGGFVSDANSWRWVFWAFAIAAFVFLVIAIVFFPESYEPILQRKAESGEEVKVERDSRSASLRAAMKLLRRNLVRPLRMVGTQPIINILAVFIAMLYGIMFLFLFTYPMLWMEKYNQSAGIASLNYISAGIGFSIGAQVAGHINDRLYIKLKARNNGNGKPEFRIPILIPGAFFVTVGLLIYGWTGQARVHWIVPNIGSLLFCMACMLCTSGVNTYTIDAYTQYAASAISALNVLRNITAIVFPLFAPKMFNNLGFGVGCTILAGCWTVLSVVVIYVLWIFGERIREWKKYVVQHE